MELRGAPPNTIGSAHHGHPPVDPAARRTQADARPTSRSPMSNPPSRPFELVSKFSPAGDQPEAIRRLSEGLRDGEAAMTLLGVTGSGKTFTIANVIAEIQRPALILAPNKTLAAQLYGEMREFFPHNAVEYFVSYYDYYQPEAYVPATDTYIEKDASINEHIEQMRLSATKALLERPDVIIVATVSSIYGLGDPDAYLKMVLHLNRGDLDRPARHPAPPGGAAIPAQRDRALPRHLPGARRRDRHLSGRVRRRGPAGRALRRRDRGPVGLRPPHRRGPAQGAPLHGLPQDPLRDPAGDHPGRRRAHQAGAEGPAHLAARQRQAGRGPAAWSSAPCSTSR